MIDTTVAAILDVFVGYRFLVGTEAELQTELSGLLTAAGIDHRREARTSGRDRIDLAVYHDSRVVGIEVKTAGTAAAVMRQMQRYARSGAVDTLILVTTRAAHTRLPATIGDMTVHTHLARTW